MLARVLEDEPDWQNVRRVERLVGAAQVMGGACPGIATLNSGGV